MPTTLELTIRRRDGSLSADARLTSAASAAATTLAANVPVALDAAALLAQVNDPAIYGTLLADLLFADPRLRDAWLKARAYAATGDLQLRLTLDASDQALHALRWETLRDPETDQPIALHERVRLVRTLDSADLTPVVVPPRPDVRALVVVANPSNLADFGLAEVDVEGEVSRARAALGDIPAPILADHAEARGRATLANLTAALRDAPPIVILVAHGTISEGTPYVWLEQEGGTADQVTGHAFVAAVERLTTRPLLLILVSCRSAGGGYGDTLRALGPQLAGIGVPALLAFQGDVAMSTVKTLLPTLITELRRDGQIDRALAAARAAVGEKRPWWQAVLWLRTDGRLWQGEDERAVAHRQRLVLAHSQHSQERFAELRTGFVGRQAELTTMRTAVESLRDSGGYLLVTGVAGQGKSSILAALVAERGPAETPAYFIRFSPGTDEQVALLRHLVADLLTQHGLEEVADSYLPETAGTITLANSLTMLLDRISKAGQAATLVIDGLDQIRPNHQMGERDLAFLPEKLPVGMVIIIGTRPDDTLKPLKLLTSQREYRLPPLSFDDFGALLTQRGVALATHNRQPLYEALHGNAFDLAFVVREIAATAAADLPALLERVRRNPQDIFAPALDRLRSEQST